MTVTTQAIGLEDVTGVLIAEIHDKLQYGVDLGCGTRLVQLL